MILGNVVFDLDYFCGLLFYSGGQKDFKESAPEKLFQKQAQARARTNLTFVQYLIMIF